MNAQDAFRSIEIEVFDAEGKPLEGATIDVAAADMEFPLSVNKEGIATLNLPTDAAHLTLKAYCENYVPLEVRWLQQNIPDDFTFKMSRGEPIGGVVQDERGQPIEGVEVEGLLVSSRVAQDGAVVPEVGGLLGTTDANGRWVANIATHDPLELRLKLTHEKYYSDLSFGKRRVSNEDLRSLQHIQVLDDRIPPQGSVTDASEKPIAEAALYVLDGVEPFVLENGKPLATSPKPHAVSDSQGKYQFAEPDGSFRLLCLAENGWALVPSRRYEKNKPVEIKLTPWARVQGILSDGGKPCAEEQLQLLVHDSEVTAGSKFVIWNNYASTNGKGEFVFERLTDGYATLGQRIEYCGGTEQSRHEFSNEFQTTLLAGARVDMPCVRTGIAVTGTIVPLHFDGSEAVIVCGMIEVTREDEAADMVRNLFFEWGKASTVGLDFDPVENAAWIGSQPKASYLGRVQADGSFRIDHVPLGSYRARVSLWCDAYDEEPAGWQDGSIAEPFAVNRAGDQKSIDLGLLEIEVYSSQE